MKILHVAIRNPKVGGGGLTRYCTELAQAEEELGNQVLFIYPGTFKESMNPKIVKKNHNIFKILDSLPVALYYGIDVAHRYMKSPSSNNFDAFFDEINPDIIHVHTLQGIHREFFVTAKERNIPIRVGVNSGSLEKNLIEKYGNKVTAEGIVESALDKVRMIEDLGYDNLVVSIKSSNVMMCVRAHELLVKETTYPLHVGITESGTIISGNIKSAVGLGIILNQGIGDTIRVSLTGDPLEEIKSAKLILKTLGLRKGGVEIVSCPTCGRTNIDLIQLANQVENMVEDIALDIKVAVMGCVVNGPGEAKEADIGIAGGIGEGLLIKKGEIIRKVPEAELLSVLREELLNWEQKNK